MGFVNTPGSAGTLSLIVQLSESVVALSRAAICGSNHGLKQALGLGIKQEYIMKQCFPQSSEAWQAATLLY